MFDFLKKIFSGNEQSKKIKKSIVVNNTNDKTLNVINKNTDGILKKDNEIQKICSNFSDRVKNTKIQLRERFKKEASTNDTYWAILQDLYLENFLTNNTLLLNVEYQRGLIQLKEKNYLDAISFFGNALVYLMLLYEDLNNLETINKKSDAYKTRARILKKIRNCIEVGFVTKEDFFIPFSRYVMIQKFNFNYDDFLLGLYSHFDKDFFQINIADEIDFNSMKYNDFPYIASKLKQSMDYFIQKNNIVQLTKVLEKYYQFGILHEYCFGNYHISVGWSVDLVDYKLQHFNSSNYKYIGQKINYLSSFEYHNKFIKEYNNYKGKNYLGEYFKNDYNPLLSSNDEFFDKKDYELFDKYLLR